jgi:hypothetical protein
MSYQIHYRGGYKYQLRSDTRFFTAIVGQEASNQFIQLYPHGQLDVFKGYSWDGSTGAIDTKESMRASLAHDALYQLMHERLLPSHFKSAADAFYWELCILDGMSKARAWWRRKAIVRFGSTEAAPTDNKPEYRAP